MKSTMLIQMSLEKKGWRPKAIADPKTKKEYRDRCMITNGVISKLVIAEESDEDKVDHSLEKRVMKEIKNLIGKDQEILLRETIILSAIGQAFVSQSTQFIGVVQREGKMELNTCANHIERLCKTIQKEAIEAHGEGMADALDNLETAAHVIHQKFGDCLLTGKLAQFMDYISEFDTTENSVKMEKV